MVNLLQGVSLGLAGLSGNPQVAGEVANQVRTTNLMGELEGMAPNQAMVSPQFQKLAALNPRSASAFQGMIKAQGEQLKQAEQAMALDAVSVYSHLKSNNPGKARDVLRDRAQSIIAAGRDPSDTMEVLNLVESGDYEGANDLLVPTLAAFQMEGILPGQQFVEKVTGAKGTSLMQNLRAAGVAEGSPEWNQAIKDSITKPGTVVNVGDKGAVKASEKLAELQVKRIATAIEKGEAAEETLSSLQQLEGIDVNQGPSEPLKVALANGLAVLGVDAQELLDVDIANAQAFNAVSSSLVNKVLNQAKGPQTEGDAQRAKNTLAQLGNKPEANTFIVNTLKANAFRAIERSEFLQEQIDTEDKTAKEANKAWRDYMRKTPLLSDASKLAKDGLPVYFFQFKDQARLNRPGITDQEIIEAWRKVNAGK